MRPNLGRAERWLDEYTSRWTTEQAESLEDQFDQIRDEIARADPQGVAAAWEQANNYMQAYQESQREIDRLRMEHAPYESFRAGFTRGHHTACMGLEDTEKNAASAYTDWHILREDYPLNPSDREKKEILIAKGWINEGKGRWHHPGFDDDTCHSFEVAWEERDNT